MDEKLIEMTPNINKTTSPDTLIEAKLSKISKAFSIENLIAKKSKVDIESECATEYANFQHQQRIPPIALPQNFPFYNPWAANYLMSHANLPPQNLLLNSQQLYQLQNDKVGNFAVEISQQQQIPKEKFTEMLFNPLTLGNLSHDQQHNLATYQQLLHHHPDQAHFFASKLKDANFLNEFYTNYFMLENSRIMNLTANSNNNNDNDNASNGGDNNIVLTKRTKKDNLNNCVVVMNNNNNDNSNNSDYDINVNNNLNNVNDHHKVTMIVDKSGMFYEEDSSYSDLSVTMSPENLQNINQDKGSESK